MLSYLFKVDFTDGSSFKQNEADVSEINPKRSSYFDLLQMGKTIRKFSLARWLDSWSLDLETGVFEHNGDRFQLEENPKAGKRKLEFFRQHQHDLNLEGLELDHRITYFFGYRYKTGRRKYLVGVKH